MIYNYISIIYETLLVAPIRRVYILGPDVFGWSGKTEPQICSILTNTPDYIWTDNSQECHNLIEKKFVSIFVVIETIFYFCLLYQMFSQLINYLFFYRPIINRLPRLLEKVEKNEK